MTYAGYVVCYIVDMLHQPTTVGTGSDRGMPDPRYVRFKNVWLCCDIGFV